MSPGANMLASGFGAADWAIVGLYLLVLLVSGWWFARREPSGAREYFLAGRRMPAWAVAFSIIASSLSVATFLGAPQIAYGGNLAYLSANIGNLIAVGVVAAFFIPAFYRHDVTTIYELLEIRFGPGAKQGASAAFMLGRVFASGARVYIAAIPLAMILFGPEASTNPAYLIAAIVALCLAGVLYTLVGGIASVIWTDVIQTVVLVGSAAAGLALLIWRVPASAGEIWAALSTGGPGGASKLTVFSPGIDPSASGWGFDPAASFTVLTAVLGWSLLNMAAYGTDHDLAQRMLTCRSAVKGSRSAVAAIVLSIPIVLLFSAIGLMLWVFYQRPDLMGAGAPGYPPTDSDRVFLTFILREMPPGLSGLMVAGLFAVALGSLNSAVNAMAATSVRDFYTHLRPGQSDRHYLLAGRWAVAGWGVVMGAFATMCIWWRGSTGLIEFALGVMTFAHSGLLAVFLCALFTRRGTTASVLAALVTGFVCVLAFQPPVWLGLGSLWPGLLPACGVEGAVAAGTPGGAGSTSGAGAVGGAHTVASLKAAWPWLAWASPWQMLLATGLALAVCVLPGGGRRTLRA
jgi:SSS family transporter